MFFKKSSPVQPMGKEHLNEVVRLIEEHDEDDAEAALKTYECEGFDNQYVLIQEKAVLGVSGYRPADNTEGAFWLSWTYIDTENQHQGFGVQLVKAVIQSCYKNKARKLFVAASDYRDGEGNELYARAHRFYKNMGFEYQLTLPDYYTKGESRIISSIDFKQSNEHTQTSWSATSGFLCIDAFEMLESDGVYALAWRINEEGQNSIVNQLLEIIEAAQAKGAERIYTGLPSDATDILDTLNAAHFTSVGTLADYYRAGIAEVNLTLEL